MKFIEFTFIDGNKFAVNMEHIQEFHAHDGNTCLFLTDKKCFKIKETYEETWKLLYE